jgi:membrane protein YdbS with pleckstrin-like domain
MEAPAVRTLPTQSLDPKAIRLWRISGLIWGMLPLAVLAAVGGFLLYRLAGWPPYLAMLPLVAALLLAIPLVIIIPAASYRNWRWDISDDEVDTMSGLFTVTRRLVPMARIQHVDTTRDVFERSMQLATVVIYTAAGSSAIPALPVRRAEAIRDQIAALANTYEDV